jgi:hypothetical protein
MLMNGARSLKDELTLHAAETTTVSAARNGSLAAAAVTSHETRYALCKALPFAQKLVSFAHVLSSTNPTAHPMRQPLIDAIAADLAEEQTKLITDTTSSPRTLDERLARFHALGALRVPQAPFGSPQADVVASLVGRVDAFLTDAQKTFGALRQYPLAEPLARARGCLDALEERALDKKGRKHAARVGKETRNESKLLERKTAERARYSAALRPAGHRVESAFDVYRRPTDARRHPG